MTLTMMELKARFAHRPLMPDLVVAKQAEWRKRWGLPPRPPHYQSTDWRYHIDPVALGADTEPEAPRLKLPFALLNDEPGGKYFLTGTRGAGKSTAAYALWDDKQITDRYTVLGFAIADYLNLAEADASQVIAVMIAQTIEALRDAGRDADLGVAEARHTLKALGKLLEKTRGNAKLEQVNLNVFGLYTAIFKESQGARAAYREYVDGHFDEVMAFFDELVGLLVKYAGKPLLFIVDDLDKLELAAVQEQVFQLQLPMLLRPRCSALYTFPLELHHNPRFGRLKGDHANYYVLENVKLTESPGGAMLADGRMLMRAFIESRLDGAAVEDYIDLDPIALDRLFHYSCGNFRELCRILQHTFQVAAQQGQGKADQSCFDSTLRQLRKDYNPFVQRYRGVLEAVKRDGERLTDLGDSVALTPLLQALAVVDYPNDPGWLGVHPIVEDLLMGEKSRL